MIPGYSLLARRIRAESNELERSTRRVERAWQTATHAHSDQDIYIDSVALNLHGFYSGLERLFEFVANQMDGGPPKGESWHRDLLRQMAMKLSEVRPPAVISTETADRLDDYRRFRHVVRNVYAEHFDPERMGKLVDNLPGLWSRLKAELKHFAEFLEDVSRADDAGPE